jgi:hypothetical protein
MSDVVAETGQLDPSAAVTDRWRADGGADLALDLQRMDAGRRHLTVVHPEIALLLEPGRDRLQLLVPPDREAGVVAAERRCCHTARTPHAGRVPR